MKYLLPILALFLIMSCVPEPNSQNSDSPAEVEGMRPIYAEGDSWKAMTVSGPEPVKNLGKIYYKDQHIYVIERSRGIHIINNTDPANPQHLKFIHLQGCNDVAIKGNILYADNFTDLVSIDISDFDNIELVNRLDDLYPNQLDYPETFEGYFECVDPTKGRVITWMLDTLNFPKCSR